MRAAAGHCPAPAGLPGAAVGPATLHIHAAAVVSSADEVVATALPFLDAGLAAGDLTVLAFPPETTELLLAELGERAGAAESDRRLGLLDARAPDALGITRTLLARAAGQGSGRLRVAGQVNFGPAPRNWREGERYESALNALLGDTPMSRMCIYDAGALPDRVVGSARSTHPLLLSDGVLAESPAFCDPGTFLRSLPPPLEEMEHGEPALSVENSLALSALRHQLGRGLAALVPDPDQRQDLHLAVSEVAANAFRHGRPPVSARLWADGEQVVCTVTDSGRGFDNPLMGFQPAHGSDLGRGGMGLWLARKLWDHVDLLPGERGLTVRLGSTLV